MATITHKILVDYFKSIATNLNGIEDFHRMNLSEIQGSFRSSADFPCLAVESHDGDFGDSNIMQSVNSRGFAFTVFTNPERGDYEDQDTKLTESENYGKKIIARMRHDASVKGHFLNGSFKAATVKYSKVGPLYQEELYGFRFVGEITSTDPLIVDPADWEDITEICQ